MPKITIITNTIRRPLDLVSKSVLSSLGQSPDVKLILMDQNPVTLTFPTEIENNQQFTHVHCKTNVPAVSMARNKAKYDQDAEWIIFCDDDGYLEAGYYQKLLQLISEYPEVDIFAGSIKRIDNGDYYSKRHALGGDMKWFMNTKLLMGSNFVVKKSVFESLGKFDEKFGAGAFYGSSEETDFAWNAFFHQKKMRYSPELVVFHVPPYANPFQFEFKKAYRYGIGKGALVRKWLIKGHMTVLYELIEMIAMPLVRAPLSLLMLRPSDSAIQLSSLCGRLVGLIKLS